MKHLGTALFCAALAAVGLIGGGDVTVGDTVAPGVGLVVAVAVTEGNGAEVTVKFGTSVGEGNGEGLTGVNVDEAVGTSVKVAEGIDVAVAVAGTIGVGRTGRYSCCPTHN